MNMSRGPEASSRRKIPSLLEVTPHLYPDVVGGIPLNVDSLAAALADDFDTTIAANWMSCKPPPTDRGYALLVFPTRLVPLGNPVSLRMIGWLLKNVQRFDLVHAHSHLFLTSTSAVFIAKLRGTPVVLTNHGFISFSQSIPLQRLWIRLVSRTILRMSDRIVCFTTADADQLVASGADPSRIVVAPNGVDLTGFKPVDRTFAGTLRIVWLGRMAREKGLQHLLDALSRLRNLEDKIHLTLMGEGPLEPHLREHVRNNHLESMVTFKKAVDRREVPVVLENHDILILPSLSEGVPRVAIEALATRMPVFCSSLPQLTTSLEDCAIYFRPGNADDIADAISWAAGNRDRLSELGERGLNLVRRKFAWQATVANREQLFLAVIRESGRRNWNAERKNWN